MHENVRLSLNFFRRGVLVLSVLGLFSCAPSAPEVEKVAEAGVTEEVKPPVVASKPVKMPPRLEVKGSSNSIGLDDFFALQQTGGALIYDVRVPYFYQVDHIPGAINWPHTEYDAQVQERDLEIQEALNAGKKVVLYCFNRLCPEARNVAKKLSRRDYDVHVLTVGIDSWREAELPLE